MKRGDDRVDGEAGRMFDPFGFAEEKQLLLAKAHGAMAAAYRLEHLREQLGREAGEVAAAEEVLADLSKDLQEILEKKASKEALDDSEVKRLAKLALDPGTERAQEKQGEMGEKRRAFDAVCFREEKHAMLAQVHHCLAADCRWKGLGQEAAMGEEAEQMLRTAAMVRIRHLKELDRNLDSETSSEIFCDKDVMIVALTLRGEYLSQCQELRGDLDVVLAAIMSYPTAWQSASAPIQADRSAALMAVQRNGMVLRLLGEEWRDDEELVLAAVASTHWALAAASDRLKADRAVVLAALERESPNDPTRNSVLTVAADELKIDRELALAAAAKKAFALRAAKQVLGADREIVLAALRSQTAADLDYFSHNALAFVSEDLRADAEIVLEAVRVDGGAIADAGLNLRCSKDFILQAVRRAPKDDFEQCIDEADESVRQEKPFEDFLGASESSLAVAGDAAPVASITWAAGGDTDSTGRDEQSRPCFKVRLLSGTTFACSLPEPAAAPEADQTEQGAPLTVAHLAALVLEEFPKHVEAETPPKRIFLLFEKPEENHDGPGQNHTVPATAWDWDRPVSDFL